MNTILSVFIVSAFITLFNDNNSIKLRSIIYDGLLITAALTLAGALLYGIEMFGDLGVLKIPFSALACFGFYSVLVALITKENAVGTVIPTAMVIFFALFDFSIITALCCGLLLTVFSAVLHMIKMRTEIHSNAQLLLCLIGLVVLAFDAVKL